MPTTSVDSCSMRCHHPQVHCLLRPPRQRTPHLIEIPAAMLYVLPLLAARGAAGKSEEEPLPVALPREAPQRCDHRALILVVYFSLKNGVLLLLTEPFFMWDHYQTRPHLAPFFYPYCPQLSLAAMRATPLIILLACGGLTLAQLRVKQRHGSAIAAFLSVYILELMALDENFISPSVAADLTALLALSRGAARGRQEQWCIPRLFCVFFYALGGGVCKVHRNLVFSGGLQDSPICFLPLGQFGWQAATFCAAWTEVLVGALMLSNWPQWGGLLAIGMHIAILVADVANLHPAFDCGGWNPKLLPFNVGLIVLSYVLFLHPRSQQEAPLLKTVAASLAARDRFVGVVLVVFVLSPLGWHTFGMGPQKLMSGMYDQNQARTVMFLTEPHDALWAQPGLMPLLSYPVNRAWETSSSPIFLDVETFANGGYDRHPTSLVEDGGTNSVRSALQWAHHLAVLASQPVKVLFFEKPSIFSGERRVSVLTVEYTRDRRVTLRREAPLWPATLFPSGNNESTTSMGVELRCGTPDVARDLMPGCAAVFGHECSREGSVLGRGLEMEMRMLILCCHTCCTHARLRHDNAANRRTVLPERPQRWARAQDPFVRNLALYATRRRAPSPPPDPSSTPLVRPSVPSAPAAGPTATRAPLRACQPWCATSECSELTGSASAIAIECGACPEGHACRGYRAAGHRRSRRARRHVPLVGRRLSRPQAGRLPKLQVLVQLFLLRP